MFSIVDIQADQEAEFEETEEGQEEDQEAPIHSYPIRCSFTITKVCTLLAPYDKHAWKLMLEFAIAEQRPRINVHRRDVPRWRIRH